jgi:hypothetical protein
MVGRPDVQQRSTAAASIEPVQNGPDVASAKRKMAAENRRARPSQRVGQGSNPLSSTPGSEHARSLHDQEGIGTACRAGITS